MTAEVQEKCPELLEGLEFMDSCERINIEI